MPLNSSVKTSFQNAAASLFDELVAKTPLVRIYAKASIDRVTGTSTSTAYSDVPAIILPAVGQERKDISQDVQEFVTAYVLREGLTVTPTPGGILQSAVTAPYTAYSIEKVTLDPADAVYTITARRK